MMNEQRFSCGGTGRMEYLGLFTNQLLEER